MANPGEALAATIDAQWNVGTGGVKPSDIEYIVNTSDFEPNPLATDAIFVFLPLRGTKERFNSKLRNATYFPRVVCQTKTDTARLEQITNEVDRIVAAGTPITGATYQDVLEVNDISDRMRGGYPFWVSELNCKIFTQFESSATQYGTATVASLETDEFTVNTWLKLNGYSVFDILDEDDMASDRADALITQQSAKAYVDSLVVVAGDLNHNDLANIDAGDINHLTDAQVAALHAVVVAGDLNHNDLANIDAGDINHLTDVQVTALHAKYTDAEVDAIVATHTADDNAHHEVVEAHADLSDTTLTGAQLEDMEMFGSTNSAWMPLSVEFLFAFNSSGTRLRNDDGTDGFITLMLPVTTLKGLKLNITGLKVLLERADAGDYITSVTIHGVNFDGTDVLFTNADNITAQENKIYDFGDVDVSSYDMVKVLISFVCTNTDDVAIYGALLECFYDT